MDNDEQYLKLLSIFHYVVGGLAALFACLPLIHFRIGIAMLVGAIDGAPAFAGVILLVLFAMAFMLSGRTLAVCLIIAGRNLAKRPPLYVLLGCGGNRLYRHAVRHSIGRVYDHRPDASIGQRTFWR